VITEAHPSKIATTSAETRTEVPPHPGRGPGLQGRNKPKNDSPLMFFRTLNEGGEEARVPSKNYRGSIAGRNAGGTFGNVPELEEKGTISSLQVEGTGGKEGKTAETKHRGGTLLGRR